MISYKKALEIIQNCGTQLPIIVVPITSAVGEVASQQILSTIEIPPFDNSAMDGFAIRSEGTKNAAPENPTRLSILGTITAGQLKPNISVENSNCYEIMTGAPLPEGTDAVIRYEDVESIADKIILISKPIAISENIRKSGEDFKPGALILNKGEKIQPHHLMALSTFGFSNVPVFRKPKIVIISTGDELLPFDASQELSLSPSKIRNSNAPYLYSLLSSLGADVLDFGIIKDDPRQFLFVLDQALNEEPDIIVTTGAVSKGKSDFIASSIERFGGEILFHQVAIRPGKPILFSKLGSDSRAPVLFGLPGNPISAAVGLRFFVEPYIRSLRNEKAENTFQAKLLNRTEKKSELLTFYKSTLHFKNNEMSVEILKGQASFMISPLLSANSWAVLPEDKSEFDIGDLIDIVPLYPGIISHEKGVRPLFSPTLEKGSDPFSETKLTI